MQHKIYHIGHPLGTTPPTDVHTQVFQELGLPIIYERCDVPPVNFHRVITTLMREPGFLGAKVGVPYKQTTLAYCQEVSPTAQGIGAVNTLVKRPSGLIYGHNTDVAAFLEALKEQGIKRVRTALVLGAGGAARVALAGLRELGCARYMVGYRHPRRPADLSSQFKGIRRQIQYFPMQEMTDFFAWAERQHLFTNGAPPPPPIPNPSDEEEDGMKRWNLLVNATPVGQTPFAGQSLISNLNYLRCFERVLDLVPTPEPTLLTQLAEKAQVPVVPGYRVFVLQAEYSRELWLREYKRYTEAGMPPPEPGRRQIVIKRRPE